MKLKIVLYSFMIGIILLAAVSIFRSESDKGDHSSEVSVVKQKKKEKKEPYTVTVQNDAIGDYGAIKAPELASYIDNKFGAEWKMYFQSPNKMEALIFQLVNQGDIAFDFKLFDPNDKLLFFQSVSPGKRLVERLLFQPNSVVGHYRVVATTDNGGLGEISFSLKPF
ncbi:hypothetical protein [Bacillus sp. 1P06AnD]|uniref:hypothetical protein n=1 Tax=Bacillus sp. 1P06AnD TaxID=3132208 RepID=UPI0039A284DB